MSVSTRWMLVGALSIAFGVLALANPFAASVSITILVGILLIIIGVFQVIAGFGQEGWSRAFGIILGILLVLLGVSFLRNPLEGVISLASLVIAFIGASGILRIYYAFRMRQTPYFWLMLLSGVASVFLAGYVIANPGLTLAILGLLLGIELVLNGAGLISLALFLKRAGRAV